MAAKKKSAAPAGSAAEQNRLHEDSLRESNWKRWGPYLAERQWGTVREDYSPDGSCWSYLPHDHARSRAYRWGEDGILGLCDRQCRICFAPAFWNGRDPILKERLFGLTGPEGNHGEDVKEEYFYVDSTPTHSYMCAVYKYPQAAYPYARLVEENGRRGRDEREFELADCGVFEEGRYFDVTVEYAKADQEDILIQLTITNRAVSGQPETIHVLPTLWAPNTWAWGRRPEWLPPGVPDRPRLNLAARDRIGVEHPSLGALELTYETDGLEAVLFTDNETNSRRLFGTPNASEFVKDAFHERVVNGRADAVNGAMEGTKAAPWFRFKLAPGASRRLRLRLRPLVSHAERKSPLGAGFDEVLRDRKREADVYYEGVLGPIPANERPVARQACAGLLWSKQYYQYIVKDWLEGDPSQPRPPVERATGRNADWEHLHNRDVISMPDKWEYPWYAAWDLAFQMIPMAMLDAKFAKDQLLLFLREWYMHPSGQIPAYEFAFGDVNPPVHAWACWRVYKMTAPRGQRDRAFLARAFQKLLLNFTWWVNRKDPHGRHVFSGGFLGLDNIGVFDRSRPLPTGGHLEQADATAWMAFYCGTMLSMALELAREDATYDDMASKFFEHFVAITDAMNTLGGTGLWDEQDGFYYDQIRLHDRSIPLRLRSLVGLMPMLAVEVLEEELIDRLPGFKKRTHWFVTHRPDLARHIAYLQHENGGSTAKGRGRALLAIPSRDRLCRVLKYMLDENEFLSPFGVRSLSRRYEAEPYAAEFDGEKYGVGYVPGESDSAIFGGNSNWRGPIWFPINYLLIEALERYFYFYGDRLRVECPTGSGRWMNLQQVADEIRERLIRIFMPDSSGRRPCHGDGALSAEFATQQGWKEHILFHEHFHADTGRGLGATHQTGWTALIATMLRDVRRTGVRSVPEVRAASKRRRPD